METNWAGNLTYRTDTVHYPESLDELCTLVAGADKVRTLGSRHCFNDIADTGGTLISLEKMPKVLQIDEQAMTVQVSAGTRYGELAEALDARGFGLGNLASLPHISVAGAISTATHGSGDANVNLAAAVSGLELVLADGSVHRIRRGEEDFEGYVVSLGALGIFTSVWLDIVPGYQVTQEVFEDLHWDAVLGDFDAVTSSAYSVGLFTDYAKETIDQAWLKRVVGQSVPDDFERGRFGGRRATRARHPLPAGDGETCTTQLGIPGSWAHRLSHFRMDFTPSDGNEVQAEYLIPRERAVTAIEKLRALSARFAPLLLVAEVRTIAADDLWLSGSYGRDSVALHFTFVPDQAAVEAVLPDMEAALAPLSARPHWGKLFTLTAGELRALYPKFDDFKALAQRLDPQGKFRNEYIERIFFG